MMKRLAMSLGLLLWASLLVAQTQDRATLDSLWAINLACAEMRPLPGGDLPDVTWMLRDPPVDRVTDDILLGQRWGILVCPAHPHAFHKAFAFEALHHREHRGVGAVLTIRQFLMYGGHRRRAESP